MPKISDSHKKKIKSRIANRRKIRKFKPPVFPDMIVLQYGKAIIKEIRKLDDLVKSEIFPYLDRITNTKNERLDSSIRLDIDEEKPANALTKLAGVALVSELIRRVKSKFYGETLFGDQEPRQTIFAKSMRRLSEPFLKRANEFSEKNFVSEFENQTGTKPLERHLNVNEFIADATTKNINLIKTVPSQYFDQIQTAVESAVTNGRLASEAKQKISEISEQAKNRSRLIARDQISKLVGVTNEARQRNLGVTHYIWRTMGDSRVRSMGNSKGYSDHQRLDGTLQKWGDPPITVFRGKRAGERNQPTEDIQCFKSGTMISTENGQKPIEEIKIGDIVHSHWGLQKVVELHRNSYLGSLVGVKLKHKTIWITPRHKVHTVNRGWVEACHLKTSDKIEKFEKFFTGNFFNKKIARNIKHPHPHLLCEEDVPDWVNFTHSCLHLNDCIKIIKHKIRLIINSIFSVWLLKYPLRRVFNLKNVEPCGAYDLRFWDNAVFTIPNTRANGCWNSFFSSFRVFYPLSNNRFTPISYFNIKKIQNFFNRVAIHSSGLSNISIRPKFRNVFFFKPFFEWLSYSGFDFINPKKNNSFVFASIGTKFTPPMLKLKWFASKLFTASPASNVHNNSCMVEEKVHEKHLHDTVQELLSQQFCGVVYNFGVDKSMSYFADGILVENCRCHASPVYDEITGIKHAETEKARKKTESLK